MNSTDSPTLTRWASKLGRYGQSALRVLVVISALLAVGLQVFYARPSASEPQCSKQLKATEMPPTTPTTPEKRAPVMSRVRRIPAMDNYPGGYYPPLMMSRTLVIVKPLCLGSGRGFLVNNKPAPPATTSTP